MTIRVLICGMPHSGNQLIQRMLERHGLEADVRHYGLAYGRERLPDKAVMPIRGLYVHGRAIMGDRRHVPIPEWMQREDFLVRMRESPERAVETLYTAHYAPTLSRLAEMELPLLTTQYETIVEQPESAGRRILAFCNPRHHVWRGWGEPIVDSNAKHLEAR